MNGIELQQEPDRTWSVFQIREYGESSVLSGQLYRARLDDNLTREEARDKYPEAEVVEAYVYPKAIVPTFDPNPQRTAEFGECWDSDY